MSNMSDCRFENTYNDFLDCLDALRQYLPLSEGEYRAAYRMIRHFLCFCKDAGIIRSFDHEAIIKHLDHMKEEPAVQQTSILDGPQQAAQSECGLCADEGVGSMYRAD